MTYAQEFDRISTAIHVARPDLALPLPNEWPPGSSVPTVDVIERHMGIPADSAGKFDARNGTDGFAKRPAAAETMADFLSQPPPPPARGRV